MKKIIIQLLTGTAVMFMTACGGGSSSDSTVDPMTERDLVIIFYHTPEGICEDTDFQESLKEEMALEGYVIDYYLFREETNNVTCSTYGMSEGLTETGGCATTDMALQDPSFEAFDTSCVIGMDADPTAQPVPKYTDTNSKTVTKDTNIVLDMATVIQAW